MSKNVFLESFEPYFLQQHITMKKGIEKKATIVVRIAIESVKATSVRISPGLPSSIAFLINLKSTERPVLYLLLLESRPSESRSNWVGSIFEQYFSC